MGLLIPIQDDTPQTYINRYCAPFACDITRKRPTLTAPFAGDVKTGDGVVVFIEVLSGTLSVPRE